MLLRIYTLGRFSLLKGDVSLHSGNKAQKKPIDLLKALIAFGGRDIRRESLSDALWPDADGFSANNSLSTTLQRLRKLVYASS
jgi:DNA-binding SARP family transcriptional activator